MQNTLFARREIAAPGALRKTRRLAPEAVGAIAHPGPIAVGSAAAPRSRAKPRSRSSCKSSMSSSPDLEAQRRPAGRPARRRAIVRAVERNHEALEAGPGIAQAEQFEPVEHRRHRRLRRRLQRHAEEARRAAKSRFQIACPGSSARAGCMTRSTSGPSLQPAREGEPLPFRLAQAQVQRAQAAQREKDVLRSRRIANRSTCFFSRPTQLGVAETSPSSRSEMAGEIFRAGLDREVHASRVRREEQRRRPGVVHDHARRRAHAPQRRWPEYPALSKLCEPGASVKTAFVFGRSRSATPAPIAGS